MRTLITCYIIRFGRTNAGFDRSVLIFNAVLDYAPLKISLLMHPCTLHCSLPAPFAGKPPNNAKPKRPNNACTTARCPRGTLTHLVERQQVGGGHQWRGSRSLRGTKGMQLLQQRWGQDPAKVDLVASKATL